MRLHHLLGVLVVAPLLVLLGVLIGSTRPAEQSDEQIAAVINSIASGKAPSAEQWKAIPPVTETSLQRGGLRRLFGGGYRDLPLTLSPAEEAAIKKCIEIAGRTRHFYNDRSKFEEDQTGSDLKAILNEHPKLFYAEYLLARWYQMQDESDEEARTLLRKAYEHAPAILVQRFAYADGQPLADAKIQTMEIECNRAKGGSLDPSLQLVFPDLRTDGGGAVYLPVYRTVYRRAGYSYPPDHDTETDTLGWFETRGKLAQMPLIRCRLREKAVVTRDKLKPTRATLEFTKKPTDEEFSFAFRVQSIEPKAQRLVQGWYLIDVDRSNIYSSGSWGGGSELLPTPYEVRCQVRFGKHSGTSLSSSSSGLTGVRSEEARIELADDGGTGRLLLNESIGELTQEPVPICVGIIEKDGEVTRIFVCATCAVGHGNQGKDARFEPPDLEADTPLNREVLRLVKQMVEPASQPAAAE